jgi:hypothetical protein
MSLKPKHTILYAATAVIFFMTGWACNKLGNTSGISNNEVVATVGGKNITFGDWMDHVDFTRIFITPVDPSNPDAVKAILKNLIDQQLILDEAQKENYSDAKFAETLSHKLTEAELNIKEEKEHLEKDLQAIQRLEKNYKDPLKKMLLASQYAKSKMDQVPLTDNDLKAWYADYSIQARQAGQAMPPFAAIKDKIKSQAGLSIQRDKFVNQLESEAKVHRNEDVISKYMNTLSATQDIFDTKEKALPVDGSKGAGK